MCASTPQPTPAAATAATCREEQATQSAGTQAVSMAGGITAAGSAATGMSSTEIAVDRTSVERLGTGQKRTAAEAFAAPEEAGALLYAQFWYYIDAAGVTQGPFDSLKMRSWLEVRQLISPSYS
eukprot:6173364-Pleurochrysis_carterae.AAC.3